MNRLYYGDNLDVLRQHIADESVDLVYLDPPFNSAQDYNVLFAEHGVKAAAQIQAFEDTWEWNIDAERSYEEMVEMGGRLSDVMRAFRTFLGDSDMMAYLAMMAPRLQELHRVLKPVGSLYLHCDPTASHYLKLMLDAVFGGKNFLSEIIWRRYGAHGNSTRYGAVHDVILFYGKTQTVTFSKQFVPYTEEYAASRFRLIDKDGRQYQEQNLSNPSPRPNLHYPYTASNGVTYQPHPNGWKCDLERMKKLDSEGRLHFPQDPSGRLRLKMYLDEAEGVPLQDVWTDVMLASSAPERLGYPTQKPLALLERIISSSSNAGDVVLDPFCGCGTTVSAAQRLNRRWIGIDITHLAIGLIKHRLRDTYGVGVEKTYEVIGEPTDLSGAKQLAEDDKYQFQWWALGLVGARPVNEKKGADKGIDGRLFFHDEGKGGKTKQIILSVKGGHLKATDVRDLRGVVDREKATVGVLISMEKPTAPMRKEAASAGFYTSPWDGGKYPRLQLLTVEELLTGKGIEYPAKTQTNVTHKKAPKAKMTATEIQLTLAAERPPPYGEDDDSN